MQVVPGLGWSSLAQVGGGRRRYLGGLSPSVDGDLRRAGDGAANKTVLGG